MSVGTRLGPFEIVAPMRTTLITWRGPSARRLLMLEANQESQVEVLHQIDVVVNGLGELKPKAPTGR